MIFYFSFKSSYDCYFNKNLLNTLMIVFGLEELKGNTLKTLR